MSNINIYDFKVKTIDGEEISLSRYKNRVLLIVNVASRCGFTPQYKALEELYQKYKEKGFMILAFPSNQFLKQEPESDAKIKLFCHENYDVHFDMFTKIDVNGENTSPLYKFLKEKKSSFFGTNFIEWNFSKFLIDVDGDVIQRYSPMTKPQNIESDIEKLLEKD